MTDDTLNAFVPGPRCQVAGALKGPLSGLDFAVKDLIDVAGWPTGGGNPDWERAHPVPSTHAWVVEQLLSAGSVAFNLVNAAFALGYAGSWVTRWFAFDTAAQEMLGARGGERFVGFVHIGTPAMSGAAIRQQILAVPMSTTPTMPMMGLISRLRMLVS